MIYYPSQAQPGAHCVTRRNSYAQPCNPPTPTSATTNFHWDWDDAARYIGQNSAPYVAPTPAPLRSCDIDAEMEDEQAVEELLNAHTPNQMLSVTPQHRQQPSKFRPTTAQQQQQQQFSTALSPPPPLGSPTLYDAAPAQSASSIFVNTDPFYLAAVQSSSSSSLAPTAPPSFFAQAARPAPNSPFNLNLAAQQGHHTLELESRTVLVGAGQGR